MELGKGQIDKALMHLAIEKSLHDMGKGVFKQVGNELYEKYGCYFTDCLDHPEYLKNVLQEMFGKASVTIIDTIRKDLNEYTDNKSISNFLVQLAK